jgi:hypothetical protein
VVDPTVGDNLDVALLPGPPKGVQSRRASREAALLATAQGAVVEYRAEGVGAQMSGGDLVITSATSGGGEAPAKLEAVSALDSNSLLDVSREAAVPDEEVYQRIAELNRRAAAEGFDIGSRATARLALAKFLVAHELAPSSTVLQIALRKVSPRYLRKSDRVLFPVHSERSLKFSCQSPGVATFNELDWTDPRNRCASMG